MKWVTDLAAGDEIDLRDLHGNWWRHRIKSVSETLYPDGSTTGMIELEKFEAMIDFTALNRCFHSTSPDGVHRFDFNQSFKITTNPRRKK